MKKLLGAPEAVAVLERFFPKILKNPALQMTAAMTLRQVAGFAQSGLTADSLAEIDAQLHLSEATVKNHLKRIFDKLGLDGSARGKRNLLADILSEKISP